MVMDIQTPIKWEIPAEGYKRRLQQRLRKTWLSKALFEAFIAACQDYHIHRSAALMDEESLCLQLVESKDLRLMMK